MKKVRRKLLEKEIRFKEKRIQRLSKELIQQHTDFKILVRRIDYIKYRLFIEETVSHLNLEWYKTHQKKFINLRTHSRSDEGLLDPDSVIINKLDYVLTNIEKLALSNGLKFSLPPSKLKSGSYLSSFELLYNDVTKSTFIGNDEDRVYFQESLSELAYSTYFNFNMNRSSLLNIPRDQYKALVSLSKNKDIIITCPDKGSGVVILNKDDYLRKMEDILSDTTKFKISKEQDIYQVSRKIERKVRKMLLDHLKKPGYISEEQYKYLYPNGSHIGVLYGLTFLSDLSAQQ